MRIELIPWSNRDQLALRIGRTAAESLGETLSPVPAAMDPTLFGST